MNKEQLATELRQEAEKLNKAADLLSPAQTPQSVVVPPTPIKQDGRKTGRRRMTKEARKKISEAQKARWAKSNPAPQAVAA